MTIWFTADQHFGHENIIEYTNRPFKNATKMDNILIKRFNERVEDDDIVYILGDLTLAGPAKISVVESWVRRLHGRKIFIVGNHDKLKTMDYVNVGFESAHSSLWIKDDEGISYLLAHDPVVRNIVPRVNVLCGHVHNVFKVIPYVVNVGVDVWNFYPVSFEDVKRCFEVKRVEMELFDWEEVIGSNTYDKPELTSQS